MKENILIHFFIIISTITSLYGQEYHFSQFYTTPLELNPALTGVSNQQWRINANYRSQWSSFLNENAFKTSAISTDVQVKANKSNKSDFFGFGLNVWSDKAGEVDFRTSKAKISATFGKNLGGNRYQNQYLIGGASFGVHQTSIDLSDAKWGNQFDVLTNNFSSEINSFETIVNETSINQDLSAGLLYFFSTQQKGSFYIGAALDNLIKPSNTFMSTSLNVGLKATLHAGGDIVISKGISKRFSIVPNIVFFHQNGLSEWNGGLSLKTLFNREQRQALAIGAWLRLANKYESGILMDAFILVAKLDLDQFSIGLSYDVNISPLSVASHNNGGFELSVAYYFKTDLAFKPVICNVF